MRRERMCVYGRGGVCVHGEREGVYMEGVECVCTGRGRMCVYGRCGVCVHRVKMCVYGRGGVCVHGERMFV